MTAYDHCRRLTPKDYEELFKERFPDIDMANVLRPLVTSSEPAFWALYPFGHYLVQGGHFRPPCADRACTACTELQEILAQRSVTIPLALVLSRTVETFLPTPPPRNSAAGLAAPTRPMRVIGPGELFGVFETLDSHSSADTPTRPPWEVSAGVRSLVLLYSTPSDAFEELLKWKARSTAGVGETVHQRLQRLKSDPLELLRLMGSLYAARPDAATDTATEVVFFPYAGTRGSPSPARSKAWLQISDIGWSQSRHFRDYLSVEDSIFRNSDLETTKIQKERLATMGVLRQILATARGDVPAFVPVAPDDTGYIGQARRQLEALSKVSHSSLEKIREGEAPTHKTKTSVLALVPEHLHRAGSTAFLSLIYNCLPWQGSPIPGNQIQFAKRVRRALTALPESSLDEDQSEFFFEKRALFEITDDPLAREQVSGKCQFLKGCFKIVRRA